MIRPLPTILALLILALSLPARSETPCATIDSDSSLLRCATLAQVEEVAAALAREPRVEDSKKINILATHRANTLDIALHVPVTPVLFLGRPAETDAEASHFERYSTRGAVRAKLWRDPQQMAHWFWVISKRREASGDPYTELAHYVLRDGYLYTEDPKLAQNYSESLTIGALFDAPSLVLQRGDALTRLERKDDGYVGPDGAPVQLRLYDRVAVDPEALGPPVALDLDVLRRAHGVARFEVDDVRAGWARVHAVTALGDRLPGAVVHDGVRTRLLLAHPEADIFAGVVRASRLLLGRSRAELGAPLGYDEVLAGGRLATDAGGFERVEVPPEQRVAVRQERRFAEALIAVPDRFVEGDALLLTHGDEQRAWLVATVDPVLGIPTALLVGNEAVPLFVALKRFEGATLLGRARRIGAGTEPPKEPSPPSPEAGAP